MCESPSILWGAGRPMPWQRARASSREVADGGVTCHLLNHPLSRGMKKPHRLKPWGCS